MSENNGKTKAREIPAIFVDATPEGYGGETQIITKYFGPRSKATHKFECKVARLDVTTAGTVYANVTEDGIYHKATKNFWYEEGDTKVTIETAVVGGASPESIADEIKSDLMRQYTAEKKERTSVAKDAKELMATAKSAGMTAAEVKALIDAEKARRAAQG